MVFRRCAELSSQEIIDEEPMRRGYEYQRCVLSGSELLQRQFARHFGI